MKYLVLLARQSPRLSVCLFLALLLGVTASGQEATPPNAATPGQANPQSAKPAPPKPTTAPAPARRPPSELQKALDEFRVQMGAFSGGGKGKIKALGKQNSLTGRVFEYLRNDLFDAIPHKVRQRGGTKKSLLRRNQFGFTTSGPVWLPKLYDGRGRTFFSFSYEGTRERIAQSAL